MKKVLLVNINIFLLLSCSNLNFNNIAPGYSDAFLALKNVVVGFNENPIDPEIIYRIPYASSYIKIGKGPRALMILESKTSSELTWVTADGVYIVTRSGRVIKTRGLFNNLQSSVHQANSFEYQNYQKKIIYHSYDSPPLNNLKLKSTYVSKGKETVALFDRTKELTLIEEKISNDYLGWTVTNKYWLDEENFVWKSEQYISPKLPKIEIEVTKKPS